jgi:N-acetylglucosamine kinase-like BadF-type ATPase
VPSLHTPTPGNGITSPRGIIEAALAMMASKPYRHPVAAGVDIGGTWVRVAVLEQDRLARRLQRPVNRVPELSRFLLNLFPRSSRRPPLGGLVVASTGIWTGRERRAVARRLRGLAARVEVLSDAQAALLGALGLSAGVLILAGTGSIVLGRDAGGRWARAGGLGPLLGDEGSAFWVGREWLRATTQGEDFMPARRLVRAPDPVARIAALAPRIFRRARRGDRRAGRIVRDAQDHLAEQAARVVGQLGLRPPIAVSWAGSVMAGAWFRRGVARALARRGVPARWHAPAQDPVVAAARLAAQIASHRPQRPRRPRRRGASSR